MNNIISMIKSKKIRCYFISPHLDDAILSAGGLILSLAYETKLTIITIFTNYIDLSSNDIQTNNVNRKDYQSKINRTSIRKWEDFLVCKNLGLPCKHLNFTVASQRINRQSILEKLFGNIFQKGNLLYPNAKDLLSGKVKKQDKILMKIIKSKLMKIIRSEKDTLIFSPIGIGKHVDHILTRDICTRYFRNIIYWSDFPYNLKSPQDDIFMFMNHLKEKKFIRNNRRKNIYIKYYRSQIKSLFPMGEIPQIPEKYYINPRLYF
jgi:hypothetical protein